MGRCPVPGAWCTVPGARCAWPVYGDDLKNSSLFDRSFGPYFHGFDCLLDSRTASPDRLLWLFFRIPTSMHSFSPKVHTSKAKILSLLVLRLRRRLLCPETEISNFLGHSFGDSAAHTQRRRLWNCWDVFPTILQLMPQKKT